MFNLISRPWTDDPEFSAVASHTCLRVVRGALRDSENLMDWADALATLSGERAEALHARVRDYVRAAEDSGSDIRAETAQLDRDAELARMMERLSSTPKGRDGFHRVALCAAHLANTHVLRLALNKMTAADPLREEVQSMFDSSVQLSDALLDLAARRDASAERVARATIESLL